VVWVPSFAEFESRKPPAWSNRRSHGLLATDKINAFNHLLYNRLRHRLVDQTSRTYGFLDLVRVSAERESWSLDGIHMDPQWYRLIMSYLLQLYCGPDISLSAWRIPLSNISSQLSVADCVVTEYKICQLVRYFLIHVTCRALGHAPDVSTFISSTFSELPMFSVHAHRPKILLSF